MESIFEKRLTVTPDYCDASGALSPLAAFTIFQGIAAQHAEVLGVGSSAMAKRVNSGSRSTRASISLSAHT